MFRWVRTSDRTAWVLFGLALLLYAPGLVWGLPHATSELTIRGWDIDSVTGIGPLAELHNLLVEPKAGWFLAYPLFHYLVLGLVTAPYMLVLWLTGGLAAPSAAYPYGFTDPVAALAALAFIGRVVSLVMGAGVVVVTYLTARVVWDRTTGILVALAMMLAGPMVYYAHTGNLDVPVLFWLSLCVLTAARIVTEGLTVRRAVEFGVFAALAVATKDQAYGPLVPAVGFLCLMHLKDASRVPAAGTAWKAPAAMILSGLAVYAIANGVLVRPNRLVNHLRFLLNFEQTFRNVALLDIERPNSASGYALLLGDVGQALFQALGAVLLIAALAGIVVTVRRSRFGRLLLVMFAGYLLLVLVPVRFFAYRFSLIPILMLVFFVGRGLAVWLQSARPRRMVSMAATAIGMAWLLAQAIDLRYQTWFDARYEAGNWIAEHTRPGDRVAYFGSVSQLPRIPREIQPVAIADDSLSSEKLRESGARLVLVIPDYSSPGGLERSQFLPERTYEALRDGSLGYSRVAQFKTAPLLGFKLDHMSHVNPPVQIFERNR